MKHITDPTPNLGPLFDLERDGPNLAPSRLRFEGPQEDVSGRRERRLAGQMLDIWRLMRDGRWRTLEEIASTTGHAQPSVSAQLRHLRKPRWGSYDVKRRHHRHGVFEYAIGLRADGRPRRRGDPEEEGDGLHG